MSEICGTRLDEESTCDLPAEQDHDWHQDSQTRAEWRSPENADATDREP
jgi:hypothetical protein